VVRVQQAVVFDRADQRAPDKTEDPMVPGAEEHDPAADTLIDSGLTKDAAIREIRRVRTDL
jgi:hypothetical protein